MSLFYDILQTPIGDVTIQADEDHILSVMFDQENVTISPNAQTDACKIQLAEYMSGQRTSFDLPLKFAGTDFQKTVWHALLDISYGQTATYSQQAERINKAKAVRAVGAANGQNKHSIVIPCHRVIGANGSLTGYAGGLDRKKWLLAHEQKTHQA